MAKSVHNVDELRAIFEAGALYLAAKDGSADERDQMLTAIARLHWFNRPLGSRARQRREADRHRHPRR